MKSDKIDLLAKALVEAQAEMPVIKMDAQNPFLKYSYATLGTMLAQVRPVLAKHKLAVTQFPCHKDGYNGLTTILMHESGQFIEDFSIIPQEHQKGLSVAQTFGVAQTYLRRYALASVLGLFADEDPDGQNQTEKPVEKAPEPEEWSEDQINQVLNCGVVDTKEDALAVLEFSALPHKVSEKTLEKWLLAYANSGKDSIRECADVANEAYLKAKKNGGKK